MPCPVRTLLVASVVGCVALPRPVASQGAVVALDARTPEQRRADSLRIHRAARNAQSRFESVRRHNLPPTWSSGSGRCDERIGRFCYWDDSDGKDDAVPDSIPTESKRIIDARATLLKALDSASRALPGDEWISAHHVRYLLEAGRPDAALQRARGCGATGWWCEALEGMALHSAARYAEADSVFATAVAAMPPAERCEWLDLTMLLDDPLLASYERATCEQRTRLNDQLWWLADPLHSRAGNDRRTEHYTRVLLDRMQQRTPSGYGVGWGDDIGELVRRYGWASYFAQALPHPSRMDAPAILAHHRDPAYHFIPEAVIEGERLRIDEGSWILRGPMLRERYAPPYATFAPLHQLTTLFRRGDSVLIVSAYDVSADTLMGDAPVTAALVSSKGPFVTPSAMLQRSAAPRRGTLVALAPDTTLVTSVEIVGEKRVRRARVISLFDDSLPVRVRISQLALFDPAALSHPDSTPATVDAFLSVARSSSTISRTERLGLFWESYGVNSLDDRVFLRVDVVRDGRSWLRRAGERIGVVGKDGGIRMTWRDASRDPGSVMGRSVVLDLTTLDPGRYRVELQLWLEGERPTTASRIIEVTR